MINFDAATLLLLNLLREALYASNAAEVHAPQGSTFGEVATCLKRALSRSILDAAYAGSDKADRIASRLFDEMIDNGEDITYNLDLLNRGIITL